MEMERDDDTNRELVRREAGAPETRSEAARPRTDVPAARAERVSPADHNGLGEYRSRFDELQAQFIEEPGVAVEKARKLVDEAMNAMLNTMRERIQRIHSEYDGDQKDTERLRLAMRSYRELMDSIKERDAA